MGDGTASQTWLYWQLDFNAENLFFKLSWKYFAIFSSSQLGHEYSVCPDFGHLLDTFYSSLDHFIAVQYNLFVHIKNTVARG